MEFTRVLKELSKNYNIVFILFVVFISIGIGVAVYFFSPIFALAVLGGMTIAFISLYNAEALVAILILFIPLQSQVPDSYKLPGGLNIFNKAIVNSTVPSEGARCPPFFDTVSTINSRVSLASFSSPSVSSFFIRSSILITPL